MFYGELIDNFFEPDNSLYLHVWSLVAGSTQV
jgi:hypothetical protein